MNPHKMKKVDISSMSPQDQEAFKKYGRLPQNNLLSKMQKERKYFDSGDYMMSKAGVASAQAPGTAIPTPEGVPHASPPINGGGLSSSPTNNPPPPPAFNNNFANFATNKPQSPERNSNSGSPVSGVGVGISPAATSQAMDMPGKHGRRPSETNKMDPSRTSPPGTLTNPSSSFVISHNSGLGATGASPVKSSALANRLDEEMDH